MSVCPLLWDPDSQLNTNPLLPKGLSADTSAAYGLLGFMGNNTRLKLVLTGTFPKAQYMSFQIYRGKPVQSEFLVSPKSLVDYDIDPHTGVNPFRTHNPNNTGTFKIEITPDTAAAFGQLRNSLFYRPISSDGPEAVITAFYRIYQPDNQITVADLPKIEARDYLTNQIIPCPKEERLEWFLNFPIVNSIYNARAEQNPIQFTEPPEIIVSGSNENITYRVSWSKIPLGKVAVIKFRAPAIDFASPDVGEATKCVRYWSICPVYVANLKTFNGVASTTLHPQERDVTVVFGPDNPLVRNKALQMQAEFLPDTRTASEEVVSFFVRNLLPSKAFKPFEGPFLPQGQVFTETQFLALT